MTVIDPIPSRFRGIIPIPIPLLFPVHIPYSHSHFHRHLYSRPIPLAFSLPAITIFRILESRKMCVVHSKKNYQDLVGNTRSIINHHS